jgi:hypothetical protein
MQMRAENYVSDTNEPRRADLFQGLRRCMRFKRLVFFPFQMPIMSLLILIKEEIFKNLHKSSWPKIFQITTLLTLSILHPSENSISIETTQSEPVKVFWSQKKSRFCSYLLFATHQD